MCNLKKILCFKLKKADIDLLNQKIESYKEFVICEEHDPEKLMKYKEEDISCLFVHKDESLELKFLENIFRMHTEKPINVILKNKDFEALMLCFKYQVSSVFEVSLSDNQAENALMKADFISKRIQENIPVVNVVKLFSTPNKIKSNVELFHRLSSYLNNFSAVKKFSVLVHSQLDKSWIGPSFELPLEELLSYDELPRQFIGKEYLINGVVATPVFTTVNEVVWLLVEVDREKKDYILNELFYKYLENVLIYRANKEKEKNLTILATVDEVTGLYNQRKLSQDLEAAIEEHARQHKTFSLMFIDVDHFKSVNDNYGHLVGSKLLQDIGEVLSLILRSSDHIYRYGGDEFVVIMPTVDMKTVHMIAQRVLVQIKQKDFFITDSEKYHLSVSIGIAEYPTDAKSATEIIKFADEMMYMSKRSGRGKVFHVNEVKNVDVGT